MIYIMRHLRIEVEWLNFCVIHKNLGSYNSRNNEKFDKRWKMEFIIVQKEQLFMVSKPLISVKVTITYVAYLFTRNP